MTENSESWSCLLENGGSYYRVDRAFASRREIVDLLAGKGAGGWESNFADSKLKLGETSSGQWQQELAREQQKWERERRELREEMVEALRKSDRDAEEALRRERERSSIKVKRAEEHHQAMQSILEDRLDRCKEDVARLKAEMEQLETSHQQRIRHNTKQQVNLKEQNVDLQEKILGLSIQEEQASTTSFNDEQPSKVAVPLRYCFTMNYYGDYLLLGPGSWVGTVPIDDVDTLQFISFGLNSCISRYCSTDSEEVWCTSENFHHSQPILAERLFEHGLQNLSICCLGLDGFYFARWQNGAIDFGGDTQFADAIRPIAKEVYRVVFGFGGSCILTYGARGEWPLYWFDDRGCYPELSQFLSSYQEDSRIVAASLSLHSPTDYIVIIGIRMDDGREDYHCVWQDCDEEADELLSDWWYEEAIRLRYLNIGRGFPRPTSRKEMGLTLI